MSVKRRDLIKYFEEGGFYLLREGGKHSIYTNGEKTVPTIKTSCYRPNHRQRAVQTSWINA